MGLSKTWRIAWLIIAAVVAGAGVAAMGRWMPTGISDYYFVRQDVPIACVMLVATAVFPFVNFGPRWQAAGSLTPRVAILGAGLLIVVGVAGHWLVMLGYDLSRDQSMASFAAQQIARGTVLTQVPEEWQPFGRAMLPLYFYPAIKPELAWASAYLPVNSALLALGGVAGQPAAINAVLLVVGLAALWAVARRIWPSRRDAAVVTLLIGATSSQLIANAMTSFAMVGHFALNMVWLALFLRDDRLGLAGALMVAFLAMGLHQFHFHPMFALTFVLWLACRGRWLPALIYGLGYLAILWFWMRGYPGWLISQADSAAIMRGSGVDLWTHIASRVERLFDYSARVWFFNFLRFFTWQNLLLLPLVGMALPLLWQWKKGDDRLILPIAGSCLIGLVVLIFQGHGFGYRYLSGVIGCFCLLAGYGWVRLVPGPGPGRHWAMVKAACCFTLLVTLPLQLAMARHMVAPYARLHAAASTADADVVLIDTEGGFLAQDLVQNGPDFAARPKVMDLSLIPADALERLCASKEELRVDRRHYRAVDMREGRIPPQVHEKLLEQRAILGDLGCAPPMPLGA